MKPHPAVRVVSVNREDVRARKGTKWLGPFGRGSHVRCSASPSSHRTVVGLVDQPSSPVDRRVFIAFVGRLSPLFGIDRQFGTRII